MEENTATKAPTRTASLRPSVKRDEIQKCTGCDRGVMHSNQITFERVTLERFLVMTDAVRRQHGLELMIGSPAIAAVLGPDEDLAKRVGDADQVWLCDQCLTMTVGELIERLAAREEIAAVNAEAEPAAAGPPIDWDAANPAATEGA